ncbi:P27 family phage terminase small subunit [Paenibacillus sp. IHBB 3054]|uniref:P27 family phage terminase small subunit n=1 Tax=Paenibacillus sp. IHBB 3054 TaxID=3425689 RepID=UPI003F6820E4
MAKNETNAERSKVERIDAEIKRLTRLLTGVDPKTKKIVDSLIKNAAFMTIQLNELQDTINANGAVSEYQNGENQWGTKKSPEVEIYNTMIKNHASIMKQLTDLRPKAPPKSGDDGFEGFVNNR